MRFGPRHDAVAAFIDAVNAADCETLRSADPGLTGDVMELFAIQGEAERPGLGAELRRAWSEVDRAVDERCAVPSMTLRLVVGDVLIGRRTSWRLT